MGSVLIGRDLYHTSRGGVTDRPGLPGDSPPLIDPPECLRYNYWMMNTKRLGIAVFATLSSVFASTVHADATAFRITDLDWRDPHLFTTVAVLGCLDITNFDNLGVKGLNPSIQLAIQTDTDSDGKLDLNYLIVFDPLNQAGAGGTLGFGANVSCTAPLAGTACSPLAVLPLYSYDNTPALCLGTLAGTTGAYNPAIIQAGTPCFVAALGTVTLNTVFPVTLRDTYVAATYSGNPATGLVNGLIRGFLTEADANATILPASFAVAGGKVLSSLFRGGVGSCSQPSPATGDRDLYLPGGISGWYVYLNFVASVVPLVSATPVAHHPVSSLELDAPVPNPFNPTTTIRYTLAHASTATLSVYDATGRRIVELAGGPHVAGAHEKVWNGRDARGLPVSSGVYFVRLESGGEMHVQKVALLK